MAFVVHKAVIQDPVLFTPDQPNTEILASIDCIVMDYVFSPCEPDPGELVGGCRVVENRAVGTTYPKAVIVTDGGVVEKAVVVIGGGAERKPLAIVLRPVMVDDIIIGIFIYTQAVGVFAYVVVSEGVLCGIFDMDSGACHTDACEIVVGDGIITPISIVVDSLDVEAGPAAIEKGIVIEQMINAQDHIDAIFGVADIIANEAKVVRVLDIHAMIRIASELVVPNNGLRIVKIETLIVTFDNIVLYIVIDGVHKGHALGVVLELVIIDICIMGIGTYTIIVIACTGVAG